VRRIQAGPALPVTLAMPVERGVDHAMLSKSTEGAAVASSPFFWTDNAIRTMPPGPTELEATTFEQLFRETAGDLRAYVRRTLQHDCDADDIVQEALLRVWSHRNTLQLEITRPLLFRIAGNLAIDRLRERRRWNKTSLDESLVDCAAVPIDRKLSAQEELALMQRTLEALPLDCRTAFVLSRLHGKSHAEIAALLGVSKSMVEKHIAEAAFRLSRARART
jgi:RNA polymerase sigma factor (sigma-70 family)